MLPDPHWKLLFRMLPNVTVIAFPLWSIPLPLREPFALKPGYTAEPFSDWGESVDRLWERASTQIGCGVVRDSQRLQRISGPSEYEVLGIRRGGELAGIVCSRQRGDRQWLICDMIAADAEALQETLAGVCNLAHEKALSGEAGPLVKAALLVTPMLTPAVESLGFYRDKYDFTLVTRILDESVRKEDLEPARWYLSAND
jgi:hypothetical protein